MTIYLATVTPKVTPPEWLATEPVTYVIDADRKPRAEAKADRQYRDEHGFDATREVELDVEAEPLVLTNKVKLAILKAAK